MIAYANPLSMDQLPEGKPTANLKVIKVGPGALGKVRVTTEHVPHPTTVFPKNNVFWKSPAAMPQPATTH